MDNIFETRDTKAPLRNTGASLGKITHQATMTPNNFCDPLPNED
jgi:hypothetical protein